MGEFKKLTNAEVSSLEAILNEGFEGFGAARRGESDIYTDEEAVGKELEFPASDERYVFDREVVVFWGQDREKRVRCAITQEALDDHFGGDSKDKVEVFRANRRTIEDIQRRKYLAGQTELDGSVLIRTIEL
jgi:Protein of unknown function (DUF1488)